MAGEIPPLSKLTQSPDGKVAIRAIREIQDPDYHFDFHEVESGKSLGRIKAAVAVSKVSFVCRWNPEGSRVALLMFYGAKQSSLLLFEKTPEGQFKELALKVPDAAQVYAMEKIQPPLPADHHGGALNGLGNWSGADSVHLIFGKWLEGDDIDDSGSNLVVSFDIKIAGGKATVEKVRPHPLMSDAAAEAFFEKNRVITCDDGS